ncbi:hypothetical protein EDF78_101348 [Rahnella sp. BIGb0236]|nr:hypothetical protein EDF78_101348 [Rahnella sp. BIGb0236]VTQ52447.1 Uncharacterised protein [Campylobacter jejuni]
MELYCSNFNPENLKVILIINANSTADNRGE